MSDDDNNNDDRYKAISDLPENLSCQCYIIGCAKTATDSIRLPLNEKSCCIIRVCNSCFQKYLAQESQTQ
jgi:hypothetical protein